MENTIIQITRTATQIYNALTYAEVNSAYQPDTRRMMREERFALRAALESGSRANIASAMSEVQRVAEMWGVTL